MSNYTASVKIQVDTWLDNAGSLLGSKRLENESLFDFKQRLIDLVRNRPSPTIEGTNFSAARNLSLERKHVLTIESTSSKPLIKVTSKYIYFYDDDTLDLSYDLYNHTWGQFKLYVDYNSNVFSVSYYNEDYENELLKKIFYGSNLKSNVETLKASKLNILEYPYIKDIYLGSNNFKYPVNDISSIINPYEYFINREDGLLYSYENGTGTAVYNYFEMPYKMFYTPISFYPFNDEDINEIILNTLYTENGLEYKKLNSIGAEYINELLKVNPISVKK